MRRIKALFDPQGLLNPGVILNDDPQAHLKNLKPMPRCRPDRRQVHRVRLLRAKMPVARAHAVAAPAHRRLARNHPPRTRSAGRRGRSASCAVFTTTHGIDTCAACGLCATACPVDIETGVLIKALRARRQGPVARRVASTLADHYGAVTTALRAGLTVSDLMNGIFGTRVMRSALDAVRQLSGGRLPKWSPTLPRAVHFKPAAPRQAWAAERVVYFPSCAARTMGAQRGDDTEALPVVAERLFRKAGFDVVYPHKLAALCCGQAFESKGLNEAADNKAAELEAALREASENARWPIVFDTSPCAHRMRQFCATRLPVFDSIEFIHDVVMPRLALVPLAEPVTIHSVCSVRKMGEVDKLVAIAKRCSSEVVSVPDVLCCGFAGDKGFNRPELNEYALRRLKEAIPTGCRRGYSSSRTCEIGLSEQSGIPYHSIINLVDARASGRSIA